MVSFIIITFYAHLQLEMARYNPVWDICVTPDSICTFPVITVSSDRLTRLVRNGHII